jgi:hypothetical protein
MDPYHFTQGHSKEIIGVGITEVSTASERQFLQIIQLNQILWLKIDCIEFLPVERDVFVDPIKRCLQPFKLQLTELIP